MNWYYVDAAGKQAGPVDDAGLDTLRVNGVINPETLIWQEGMTNWQPFREVKPGAGGSASPVASGIEEAVCAQCGGVFPLDETIRAGNARVCANCKPIYLQKMQEGLSVEQPGTLRYAGFWIRFGAYFLDGILLGIVNSGLNLVFGFGIGGLGVRNTPAQATVLFMVLFIFELCVGVGYETFMIGNFGATLGKMACKLQVVTADGGKVSYPRAMGRYFSKILSSFLCLVGFIMAGFDPEKRALHDRICNTRVVYK
jgi:uncharacterized RDD family membrane protein YckC